MLEGDHVARKRSGRSLKNRVPSMTDPSPRLPLLQQREIEARIVGPLVRAFAAELGEEKTLALVRSVIADLAQSGGDLPALGSATLEAFARASDRWSEGGASRSNDRDVPRTARFQRHPLPVRRDLPRPRAGRPRREPLLSARLRAGARVQPRNPSHSHADDHGGGALLRFPLPGFGPPGSEEPSAEPDRA